MGVARAVLKRGAGFRHHGSIQGGLYPVFFRNPGVVGLVAGGDQARSHGQQVANGDARLAGVFKDFSVGQELPYGLVQLEKSLFHGNADQGGKEAFRSGFEVVRFLAIAFTEIFFGNPFPLSRDDDTIHALHPTDLADGMYDGSANGVRPRCGEGECPAIDPRRFLKGKGHGMQFLRDPIHKGGGTGENGCFRNSTRMSIAPSDSEG